MRRRYHNRDLMAKYLTSATIWRIIGRKDLCRSELRAAHNFRLASYHKPAWGLS